MENIDGSLFDVIVSCILTDNSNDSLNCVLLSLQDTLTFSPDNKTTLHELSAVVRISVILQEQEMVNEIKKSLMSNITNIVYFTEKYVRNAIS